MHGTYVYNKIPSGAADTDDLVKLILFFSKISVFSEILWDFWGCGQFASFVWVSFKLEGTLGQVDSA
jgi:hypothetical protein